MILNYFGNLFSNYFGNLFSKRICLKDLIQYFMKASKHNTNLMMKVIYKQIIIFDFLQFILNNEQEYAIIFLRDMKFLF